MIDDQELAPGVSVPAFDVERERYRRERAARLERENAFLRGDLRRAEHLLGLALHLATRDLTLSPWELFGLLCAWIGTNPARSYAIEQEEKEARLRAAISLLEADVAREAEQRRVEARAA